MPPTVRSMPTALRRSSFSEPTMIARRTPNSDEVNAIGITGLSAPPPSAAVKQSIPRRRQERHHRG